MKEEEGGGFTVIKICWVNCYYAALLAYRGGEDGRAVALAAS